MSDPLDRIEYHVGHLRSLWRGGVVRDLAESEAGYESALGEIRGAVEALRTIAASESWQGVVAANALADLGIGDPLLSASFPRSGLYLEDNDG